MVSTINVLIDEPRPFYSALDEDYFFQCMEDDIDAITGVNRDGFQLCLTVVTPIDDVSLRDLIALFMRYDIDMRPLVALATESNKGWLEDTTMYWHQKMFG